MNQPAEAAPDPFSNHTGDRNCRARHNPDRSSHAAIRTHAGRTNRTGPNSADLQTHAD